jgi:hypothetical protein
MAMHQKTPSIELGTAFSYVFMKTLPPGEDEPREY